LGARWRVRRRREGVGWIGAGKRPCESLSSAHVALWEKFLFIVPLGGLGAVVRLGRQVGVSTPLHDILYRCLLLLEWKARGRLQFAV